MNKLRSSPKILLAMLFILSIFNYLDRQIISIMQELIKHDLKVTDTQLGSLSFGFGIMYSIFALPIGRLTDRFSRKNTLLASVSAWSAVTVATAWVTSFPGLLLARMGVAIGEAGVNPAAHSMIADRFSARQRPLAVAIFALGLPIGIMLTVALGGYLGAPLGWRNTFMCFGIPGLAFALLFHLVVAEPERGQADAIRRTRPPGTFGHTLRKLLGGRSFRLILMATTLQSVTAGCVSHWMASFYIRDFALSTASAGLYLGPIFGVGGVIGILASAAIATMLGRNDLRWQGWIPAIGALLGGIFLILALFQPTLGRSLAMLGASVVCLNAFVGIADAVVQGVVPAQMRGVAAAVKTIGTNLLGFGLGSQLAGVLSDALNSATGNDGLRYALALSALGSIVATLFYLLASPGLETDMQRSREDSEMPAAHPNPAS